MTSSGGTSTTSAPQTLVVPTTAVPTTDPGIPPAARVDSIEGGQEFVRYVIAQFNRSWTDADPTLLVPLCLPSSKTCAAYIGTAQDYRSRGLRYAGIPFDARTIVGLAWTPGHATVRARGSQPAGHVVDSNGSVVETVPESNGGLVFVLEFRAGWQVAELKADGMPS